MSKGINKVIIIGNLGNEPESRQTHTGLSVTTISVATSESWKDKQSGEKQERTEWHRIVFYDRLADIAAEYLKKGSKVYIEGSLRTNKWQDKDGSDRYRTEIVASALQMLDSKGVTKESGYESKAKPAPNNSTYEHTFESAHDDQIPF